MSSWLIEKLTLEGWVQQFTASGDRLQEAVEEYRRLGFDVKTIPVSQLGCDGCTVCFDDENDRTEVIFTKKVAAPPDNELYDSDDG